MNAFSSEIVNRFDKNFQTPVPFDKFLEKISEI